MLETAINEKRILLVPHPVTQDAAIQAVHNTLLQPLYVPLEGLGDKNLTYALWEEGKDGILDAFVKTLGCLLGKGYAYEHGIICSIISGNAPDLLAINREPAAKQKAEDFINEIRKQYYSTITAVTIDTSHEQPAMFIKLPYAETACECLGDLLASSRAKCIPMDAISLDGCPAIRILPEKLDIFHTDRPEALDYIRKCIKYMLDAPHTVNDASTIPWPLGEYLA